MWVNRVRFKKNDGAKKCYFENQIEIGGYEFRLKPIFTVVQFSLVYPVFHVYLRGKMVVNVIQIEIVIGKIPRKKNGMKKLKMLTGEELEG